ncbi:TKL kinase [Brachionus plicatilis]|uniref:TKL kinase n=1 Tax=Brachionus plicatilis TaxID=10195 RepID=A0A3M7SN02_BRAPC|nr:TKL kinase [Brachionus plicatilis]
MEKFKLQNYSSDSLINLDNFSLFYKFCFVLPENKYELSLGKLIVTNCYVPNKVKENLKFKHLKQLYNCVELSSKELIMENLIYSLIESNLSENTDIIDLSCSEKNALKNFKLEFSQNSDFSIGDFDILEKMVVKRNIASCELRFHNQKCISQSVLSNFVQVKSLHIFLNRSNNYDPNLFENFNNLQHLTISDLNDMVLRKNLFTGLKKLKSLKIESSMVKIIENCCFENLKNLERLDLEIDGFNQIEKSNFYGLNKLKDMSITLNLVEGIQNDVFEYIPDLRWLKIRVKSSNQDDFLNSLDFYVQNLKLIIMDSSKFFDYEASKLINFQREREQKMMKL